MCHNVHINEATINGPNRSRSIYILYYIIDIVYFNPISSLLSSHKTLTKLKILLMKDLTKSTCKNKMVHLI